MPKAAGVSLKDVKEFFSTGELEIKEMVLELCKGIITDRQKVNKARIEGMAKARAAKTPKADAPASTDRVESDEVVPA